MGRGGGKGKNWGYVEGRCLNFLLFVEWWVGYGFSEDG